MFLFQSLTKPIGALTQYYRQKSTLTEVDRILNNVLENLVIDKENLFAEIEGWKRKLIQEIEDEAEKTKEYLNNDFQEKRRVIQIKQEACQKLIRTSSNQENDEQIQSVIDSCNGFTIQLMKLEKIQKEIEFLQIYDDTIDADSLSQSDDQQEPPMLETNQGMEIDDQRDDELVQTCVEVLANKSKREKLSTEDKSVQTCAESTLSRNIQAQKEETEPKKVTNVESKYSIVQGEICPVCYMIFQIGTPSEYINKHTLAHNIY